MRFTIFAILFLLINWKSAISQEKAKLVKWQEKPVMGVAFSPDGNLLATVAADKKIIISVPVKLNGSSEGVKQGGKLALKLRSLKAKGYAKDFPDTLDIDVTELSLGKSIKVGELTFDKLELLDPKNAVVTTVKLTRSAV